MQIRLGIASARRFLKISMADLTFPCHAESIALVRGQADQVFAYLDDPRALAAHMGESSMMMAGSSMSTEVVTGDGRAIGSTIRMSGSMLGISLSLDEVVRERQPPHSKNWETIGTPKLIIIGHYRMGFEVTPVGESSQVSVFIDYRRPASMLGYCLGILLGGFYARWCTKQMTDDAVRYFNSKSDPTNTGRLPTRS